MLINVNLVDLMLKSPPQKGVNKKILYKLWKFVKHELGYGYKCSKCHRQAKMNYFGAGSYPVIGFFCDDCKVGWSIEFFEDNKQKKRLQFLTRSE